MMQHPGVGSYPVPGSPLQFSETPRPEPALAPVLGAHTEEILADVAGLDAGEIARLFDAGVVQQAGQGAARDAA